MKNTEKAVIALADGTIFHGTAFGALAAPDSPVGGEVVFNTTMTGYQEVITDPSYAGQIMTFTYPHIGNVGCNELDRESAGVFLEGVVIRNLSRVVSNFRAEESLSDYLSRHKKMGIARIDTRRLVRHIRDHGAQMGAMAVDDGSLREADLVDKARSLGSMVGKDYVQYVSCAKPYTWNELSWSLKGNTHLTISNERLWSRPHVVVVDSGVKYNILRMLVDVGFRVTVVPATHSAEEIENLQPDACFFSNGPGDPAVLHYLVETLQGLLGKLPIFGICLGHQILAQALGGKTYKLKFGHHGANHPVMDLQTRKVEITVQNHGFAVDAQSLPENVDVTHLNLNDETVEGLTCPEKLCFSVQYHPEASSGPHDSEYLFQRFFEMVVGYK